MGAIEYKVDISQVERLVAKLKTAGARGHALMAQAVSNAVTLGIREVAMASPRKTGFLSKWRPRKYSDLFYEIFSPAPYALYLERGTGLYGPYRQEFAIWPKRKNGMLRWPAAGMRLRKTGRISLAEKDPQYEFAPFVIQKGIRPRWFIKNSMPKIDRYFKEQVDRASQELTK